MTECHIPYTVQISFIIMNELQRTLLKVLSTESSHTPNTSVEKVKYLKVLDECTAKYGEVDLALAVMRLREDGFVRNLSGAVLGPLYLTESGLLEAKLDT